MATTIKNAMEQLAIAVMLDFKKTKKDILGDNVSMSYNTLAKIENITKNSITNKSINIKEIIASGKCFVK